MIAALFERWRRARRLTLRPEAENWIFGLGCRQSTDYSYAHGAEGAPFARGVELRLPQEHP
jgi:hypothetical protein